MRKILLLLLVSCSFAFGQNGFYQLDFESSVGYTTSISEFSDGYGDFFLRTDGSGIASSYNVSGKQGNYYFAAMDINGEGASLPVNLTLNNIDISGQTELQFSILLAEDDDGSNEDWDASDYVHITYQIDGGSWENLLWVENDGSTYNSAPQIDSDFDGTGDGATITSTFAEFITSISGTGNSININIEFNLNSADEDIAIDYIRIGSNETPLPVELTTFTASVNGNNVELKWETATEVNNYGFEIERKTENSNISSGDESWEKVSFVNGYGNSNSQKYYSFTDNEANGSTKFSYRLKQIDFDGKFEYSDVIEVNLGTPDEFVLNQNYPNPFNPTTKIQFTIPSDVNVKLSVYNILGEEIAELLNENLSAGNHSVKFNASEFNSGIYFYKIEAGNYSQIRKMMLVK